MPTAVVKLTAREQAQKDLMEGLAKLGGSLNDDELIGREGTKLNVPLGMELEEAASTLIRIHKSLSQVINLSRSFEYRPWDGAYAFQAVAKAYFGALQQKTQTHWLFGDIPPRMINIATGPGQREQIPWDQCVLPMFPDSTFELGQVQSKKGPIFNITYAGPRRYQAQVNGLFTLIEDYLKHNSIYRGKAFTGETEPEYLNINIDPESVVYSDELMSQLEANLWSVIKWPESMTSYGLPLRRSVVFSGEYGNGKTLAVGLTAKTGVENGWTVIQCRAGKDDLGYVLQTAELYEPCVVLFEDVDTVASANDGSAVDMSRVLDMMDGMTQKGRKLVCVFTTNHPDKIHKGMLRPGRLDAVITFGPLDLAGTTKLININVPAGQLGVLDYDAIHAELGGFQPAFVKEVIDRAKRYSMARNSGKLNKLETADFLHAARGLRPQLDLMNAADETVRDNRIETNLRDIVGEVVIDKASKLAANHWNAEAVRAQEAQPN